VRFGHFCLPTYFAGRDLPQEAYMRRLVDFFASSEDLGFDALWANEHHFHPYGGLLPSPPIMLAALAQRTQRVLLGTSVMVLPLHDPIELAEQLAMVDLMSGGRVQLGFGRGFVVHDYEVLGRPYAVAQEQALEAVDVILKAWSGAPFTHQGKHYHYPVPLEVWPQPVQRPHPPVWMSATRDPTSFACAGERGYNLLSVAWVNTLSGLAALVERYRQGYASTGKDPCGAQVCTHYQVVVAPDGGQARDLARAALSSYVTSLASARSQAQDAQLQALASKTETDVDIVGVIEQGRVLAGTPEEVVDQLEVARAHIGMNVVDCNFFFGGIPFEMAQRSLRLFGERVIPRFH
jgi:natural product biosynthesis luciferase-like monooxygenase protein